MPSPWTSRLAMLAGVLALGGALVATAQQKPEPLTMGPGPRARRQHHAGLRRLVPERRRQLQPADRLLQPQLQGSARHSGRPQQPDRARRSRPGPADASSRWAASGACSSSRCRRTSATRRSRWTIVANGETQSIPFTLNKGYPITPFKEARHGQPAAGALRSREGGAEGHRAAGRRRRQPDRHGRTSRWRFTVWVEDVQGDEGRPRPRAAGRRWPRCRSTSIAVPAR